MTNKTTFNKSQIESMPVFFIIGRERSGTTLLRFLCDAHPNIEIPIECPYIIQMYSKYGNTKVWTSEKLMSFYDDLFKLGYFNLWTIDKDKLRNDLLACEGITSYGTICKTVHFNYISFNKKQQILVLGDKNPVYLLFIKKILKIFPEAKFVHLVRDYRDNILSMMKINLEAHIFASLAYRWKVFNKKVINFKQLYPQQFLTVKYENLVNDSSNSLKEICEFLNVDYNPLMLDFHKLYDEYKNVYPQEFIIKYFSSLFQPLTPQKVDGWKNTMSERQIITADSIVGDSAELFGYERCYKKRNIFVYTANIPAIIHGGLYYYIVCLFYSCPLWLSIKIINLFTKKYLPPKGVL